MLKIIRYFCLAALLIIASCLKAQDNFTTEIGVHGGGFSFIGDVQPVIPDQLKVNYGFTFRYLFNQRISLLADFNRTSISGNFLHSMPDIYSGTYALKQPLNMLDLAFAFNFLDYGKVDNILKSSNFSTYLFGGLGVVDLGGNFNTANMHLTIPLGIGFKVKLARRLHTSIQFTHRLMIGYDGLEGENDMNNPVGLNGNNIFNNDHPVTLAVSLTYNMFRRNCKCQNYH